MNLINASNVNRKVWIEVDFACFVILILKSIYFLNNPLDDDWRILRGAEECNNIDEKKNKEKAEQEYVQEKQLSREWIYREL